MLPPRPLYIMKSHPQAHITRSPSLQHLSLTSQHAVPYIFVLLLPASLKLVIAATSGYVVVAVVVAPCCLLLYFSFNTSLPCDIYEIQDN